MSWCSFDRDYGVITADILYEHLTAVDVGHVLMIDAVYHKSAAKSAARPEAKSEASIAADPQATITRVTFRDIVGRGDTGAGYFKCQPSSPCTRVKLEGIDIVTSRGQPAEFGTNANISNISNI